MAMLYKSCTRKNAGGAGFEERRDTALNSLENGIEGANGGFYTANYQNVYALGQCEGDVGASDCADCVKTAVQRAQVECGSSVGGQIYLHKCFISYSYYANGAPKLSSPSDNGGGGGGGGSGYSSGGGSSGMVFLFSVFLGLDCGIVRVLGVKCKLLGVENCELIRVGIELNRKIVWYFLIRPR